MRVVLVLADAMRADHMSCMGYDKETTPNLDDMASKGILFQEAYAEFSYTGPSVATLLTSRKVNGVVSMRTLPKDEFTMLPEVTDTFLVSACGLFQQAEWHRGVKESHIVFYKTCTELTTLLLEYIEDHTDGLFIAHFIDTHVPYKAGDYREEFDVATYPDTYVPMWHGPYGVHKHYIRQFKYDFPVEDSLMGTLGFHMAQYDGAIKSIDSQVERIRMQLAPEDVIIFLSDHGELFGEHDYYCNHPANVSYKESLHVPLLVYTKNMPISAVIPEKVSLIDVAPTICELLQVPTPDTFEGSSLMRYYREDITNEVVLNKLKELGYI